MITLREIGSPLGLKRLRELSLTEEDQAFTGGHRARKATFAERLLIDSELHTRLVHRRIAKVYETQAARLQIGDHVNLSHNLLKKMADRVAIAYDTPPQREIKGAPEDRQRAFLAAYREARAELKAPSWARNAWLCNVVHVLPRVEFGKLTWATVLPHAADVIFDPQGEERPSILFFDVRSHGARWVAVDAERWWWISDRWELVLDEPHAMGPRPWAEFRTASPPEHDYWDRGRGQSLVDGTLESARIHAHMTWARKHQSKAAAYIIVGSQDELPPGQMINGEDPLFIRGDNVTIGKLDMILPVKEFTEELSAIARDIAEAIGVPYSVTETDPGAASPRDQAQLVKVRDAQIKWLKVGETQLATSTAAELARVGHPGAYDPAEVAERFRISFAPLTFADHPLAKVDTAKAEMSIGATSEYGYYARSHGITLEEARDEVLEHLEQRAEFLDLVTKRNLPGDGNDGATLPERQGQVGGRTAAENNDQPQPPDGTDDTDGS